MGLEMPKAPLSESDIQNYGQKLLEIAKQGGHLNNLGSDEQKAMDAIWQAAHSEAAGALQFPGTRREENKGQLKALELWKQERPAAN